MAAKRWPSLVPPARGEGRGPRPAGAQNAVVSSDTGRDEFRLFQGPIDDRRPRATDRRVFREGVGLLSLLLW